MTSGVEKMRQSVGNRQKREKEKVLECLRKMPIVQVACERASVGRATYYRWRDSDARFRKEADEAVVEGERLITDMSESQLITLIRDKRWEAISFWLKHHHPKFKNQDGQEEAQNITFSITQY